MTVKSQQKILLKDRIMDIVIKEKPQSVENLLSKVEQQQIASRTDVLNAILELENEGKLSFSKSKTYGILTTKEYLLTKDAGWYWVAIGLAAATAISAAIPFDAAVYARYFFAALFVSFLPGFAIVKALFPEKIKLTDMDHMDWPEAIGLSIGLSFAVVPIVAFALNYTAWGITLVSLLASLVSITVVFTNVAVIREHQLLTRQSTAKP